MHNLCFRYGVRRIVGRYFTSSLARTKDKIDPVQAASLEEKCLLVDRNDKVIGAASKKECHTVKPDGTLPLHRAFSVFLFDKKGELLLQKRADTKVINAGHYTSSCTGHPIADIPEEKEEKDALGVRRAAVRRLGVELGVTGLVPDDVFYLTRAYHFDTGDGKWGEHHIVYILFVQKDVKFKPNPDEISEFSIIPKGEINEHLAALNAPMTPFFQKIFKRKLQLWWNNLDKLDAMKDHDKIQIFESS